MLYAIGKGLSAAICKIFGRWKVIGRENIPREGGVLLCGNHVSYIDPPALGGGATRPVHFMAKFELFQVPVLGFLIRNVGAFPVRQKTADRAALKKAIELLEAGEVVGMFPEGKRNMHPEELLPAEPGVGMIVLRAKVPVIPVAPVSYTHLVQPIGPGRRRLVLIRPQLSPVCKLVLARQRARRKKQGCQRNGASSNRIDQNLTLQCLEWKPFHRLYLQYASCGGDKSRVVLRGAPLSRNYTDNGRSVKCVILLPLLLGSVACRRASPVSYTHLDVYKRQSWS